MKKAQDETSTFAHLTDAIPRLALRPREAAAALGIGVRLLWEKTNAGEIPHTRIGRAVVYPIKELREYLANASQASNRRTQ